MWVLIIILVVGAAVLMLFTYLNRKKKQEEVEVNYEMNEECCGAHEVCDKDSLLTPDCEIVYYDDEELDELARLNPSDYTKTQRNQLSEVFYTLKESDVAGWLRSLQLRSIALPDDIKEQALMIVRERRTIGA
ncbi:MAG: phospholipase [Paludibacter sp.]|nr:phospholipase [Paludibacter sp.]